MPQIGDNSLTPLSMRNLISRRMIIVPRLLVNLVEFISHCWGLGVVMQSDMKTLSLSVSLSLSHLSPLPISLSLSLYLWLKRNNSAILAQVRDFGSCVCDVRFWLKHTRDPRLVKQSPAEKTQPDDTVRQRSQDTEHWTLDTGHRNQSPKVTGHRS